MLMNKRELDRFGAKNLAHLFLLRENELQSLFDFIYIYIDTLIMLMLVTTRKKKKTVYLILKFVSKQRLMPPRPK